MSITYRTLGIWGAGKGANLQPAEVDANFYSLAQAIVDLQNNPEAPNGIESIQVSGTQMTIYLTNGDVMGPFTLPVLTFRWRGEWDPFVTYAVLDVFTVASVGIFMVQIAYSGTGAAFDPDLATPEGSPYWLQLFGSVDMSLSGLGDVEITSLQDNDFIRWVEGGDPADSKWKNVALGDIIYQDSDSVYITGGRVTGLTAPLDPSDAVTKAYVDALPAGMMVADNTMMANIAGLTGPALPNSLSSFLDYTLGTSTRGTVMYRGASGWQALTPGTSGYFLKTNGSGVDVSWAPGGAGVVSITAGSGITAAPNPLVASGTIALSDIANGNFLSNISGAAAPPTPHTLSAFLDSVLTTARGAVLTRTTGGWVALLPGLTGQYLKATGAGSDLVWDSPAGSGTVTSINSGTGISTGGAPITGTGTLSLASVANQTLLANISGSSAAPTPTLVSTLLDSVLGSTQGSLVYRGASVWTAITPGTAGQVLTTGGGSANPSWAASPSGAPISNLQMLANISGSTATATGQTVSAVLDAAFSSARGSVLYRGSAGWQALAAGTSGDVLTSGGTAADPAWAVAAGGGSPPGGTSGQVQFNSAGAFGGFTVGGDASLNTSTGVLTLATANTSIGTFQGLTLNSKGQVTAATNQGYLTANQTITLSGDVTGSGATSVATTVAGLQGQPVAATAPTSSQVLQFNGTAWEPATLSGGGAVSITAGTGLTATPSPITGTGSLALTVPVSAVNGGTAQTTWAQGDLLYASAANTLAKLAKDAAGTRYLSNTGTTNNPAWARVDLGSGVTGTLATTLGGTGLVSWAQGDIPYYQSSTALSKLAKDTNATRYISNTGSSNAPAWAQVNLANGVTGTLPLGSGGTGQTTAAAALTALGGLSTTTATATYLPLAGGTVSGPLTVSGLLGTNVVSSTVAGQSTPNLNTTGTANFYVDDSGSAAGNGGALVFSASNGAWRFAAIKADAVNGGGNTQGSLYISTRRVTTDTTLTQTAKFDELGACLNTSGSWTTFSDRSLKQDVEPYERGLDAIVKLSPVQFRYKPGTPFATEDRPSQVLYGLIADEVLPHIPEACGSTELPLDDDIDGEKRTVATLNPTDLLYSLINAVKELTARVASLEEMLADDGR